MCITARTITDGIHSESALKKLPVLLTRELPETSRDRTSLKLVLHKRQDKARKYFASWPVSLGGVMCRALVESAGAPLITLLPPLIVGRSGRRRGDAFAVAGQNARKVIAIDNSPKMVEFGGS